MNDKSFWFEDGLCLGNTNLSLLISQSSSLITKPKRLPAIFKFLNEFLSFIKFKFCDCSKTKGLFDYDKFNEFNEAKKLLAEATKGVISKYVNLNKEIENYRKRNYR